ncbi:unnamed protein product [Linum tenue]|nr:unnamed protein product [Linum tenue]CAI0456014.1 unnamed protein product [Linum tenue]
MKNGCFLVRFRSHKDYELACSEGPWLLGDTYLTVFRWYKGFNPWKVEVKSTPVWVQLPDLPIEFFNAEAVTIIAQLIGRPVRVDRATEMGARGNYARVCVEVDLSRPLLSQYKVEGTTYLIQYEGLEDICGECGMYGNKTTSCKCHAMGEEDKEMEETVVPETQDANPTEGRVYGEWMTVKKKVWQPMKRVSNSDGRREEVVRRNRFHVLNEQEGCENDGRTELMAERERSGGEEVNPGVQTSGYNEQERVMEGKGTERGLTKNDGKQKMSSDTAKGGKEKAGKQVNVEGAQKAKVNKGGKTQVTHGNGNSSKRGNQTADGAGNLSPSGNR